MKHLKIAFGLVVLAGLMAVSAVPAMAAVPRWVECVGGGGAWPNADCVAGSGNNEWGTKELEGTSEVTSSGKLTLADIGAPGGTVEVECKGKDLGWVANLKNIAEAGEDGTFAITSIECAFVSGKNGSCEATGLVRANPVHLPWGTKLIERNGAVRDLIIGGTGGGPGWNVECTVGGIIKISDVCEAESENTTAVRANRTALTVEFEFDKATLEEQHAKCSLSKENSGTVQGILSIKLRTLHALWILAPALKT